MNNQVESQWLGQPINPLQLRLHADLATAFARDFESRPDQSAIGFLGEHLSRLEAELSLSSHAIAKGDTLRELSFCLDRMQEQITGLSEGTERHAFAALLLLLPQLNEPMIHAKVLFLAHLWLQTATTLRRDELLLHPLRLHVHRILAGPLDEVWSSVACFLLLVLFEGAAATTRLLEPWLERWRGHDGMVFFKAHSLDLAKSFPEVYSALLPLLDRWLIEESPYVKIRLAELLSRGGDSERLAVLLHDDNAQVVCAAAWEMSDLSLQRQVLSPAAFALCLHALLQSENSYVLHLFSIDITTKLRASVLRLEGAAELKVIAAHAPELIRFYQHLRCRANSEAVRRQATLALRWLDMLGRPLLCEAMCELAPQFDQAHTRLKLPLQAQLADEELMDCLTLLAHHDLGLEIERRSHSWRLWRGYAFSWSAWRLVYEWRHRSSIKRQGQPHWISRARRGSIKIPSQRVCELVATTIPGEPLFLEAADGWRPWLPLACDFYRLLHPFRQRTLRLYTPEGQTTVHSPTGVLQRCQAWCRLVWDYSAFALSRNWQANAPFDRHSYIAGFRCLGFKIDFRSDCPLLIGDDPSVVQHFKRESL